MSYRLPLRQKHTFLRTRDKSFSGSDRLREGYQQGETKTVCSPNWEIDGHFYAEPGKESFVPSRQVSWFVQSAKPSLPNIDGGGGGGSKLAIWHRVLPVQVLQSCSEANWTWRMMAMAVAWQGNSSFITTFTPPHSLNLSLSLSLSLSHSQSLEHSIILSVFFFFFVFSSYGHFGLVFLSCTVLCVLL